MFNFHYSCLRCSRSSWSKTSSWCHRQSWGSLSFSTWVSFLSSGSLIRSVTRSHQQSRPRNGFLQLCLSWFILFLIQNSSTSSPFLKRWGVLVWELRPSCSFWLRGKSRSKSCGCGIWLWVGQAPWGRICWFSLPLRMPHKVSTEHCHRDSAKSCSPSNHTHQ